MNTQKQVNVSEHGIDPTPIESAALAKVLPDIVRALRSLATMIDEKETIEDSEGNRSDSREAEVAMGAFGESLARLQGACRS